MHPLGTNGFECIVAVITSAITVISTAALALIPDPTDELKLLLVPMIGALLVSGGTIMLYPEKETRPIVIGRASIAFVFASLTPQILAIVFTSLATYFEHPVILIAAGAALFIPFYILIRPLFEGMYRRRREFADALIEKGEEKLIGNVRSAARDAVIQTVTGPQAQRAAHQLVERAESVAQKLEETADRVKAAADETQRISP